MTENRSGWRGMQRVELAERQYTISLFPLGDGWVRKDRKPLFSLHLYFRSGGALSMQESSLLILGMFLLLAAPF